MRNLGLYPRDDSTLEPDYWFIRVKADEIWLESTQYYAEEATAKAACESLCKVIPNAREAYLVKISKHKLRHIIIYYVHVCSREDCCLSRRWGAEHVYPLGEDTFQLICLVVVLVIIIVALVGSCVLNLLLAR